MTNRDKRYEELGELLGAIDDGIATPEQCDRLNDILRGDPEACEFYLDYMAMSANLELEFGASKPIGLEEDEKPENILARTTQMILQRYPRVATTMWNNKGWMSAAAMAMLSASVAGWMLLGRSNDAKPAQLESVATDDGVAVLVRTLDADFGGAGEGLSSGDTLSTGEIRLDHGVASIEFYGGARVLVEGGTVFELISENEGFLKKGRVRVQVPPQAGKFILDTTSMDLVARGAEFGAFIGDGGVARVHNFEGRVDVVDEDDIFEKSIFANRGLQARMDGTYETIDAEQSSFLSWIDIVESSRANARWRYRDWIAYIGEMSTDPRMVAHYTFEDQEPGGSTLEDHAAANSQFHNGAIVSAQWDKGRWSDKGALRFRRNADRVHVKFNRDEESMTWLGWVRVDHLRPHIHALVHGNGADAGTTQWHLTADGELELKVSNGDGWVGYTSKKPIYKRGALHQKWKQLATVYHADAGYVIHYADGKEVSRHPVEARIALRLRNSQIGNAHRPKGSREVRFLSGAIDELVIFNQPLSASEIDSLYEVGKPE